AAPARRQGRRGRLRPGRAGRLGEPDRAGTPMRGLRLAPARAVRRRLPPGGVRRPRARLRSLDGRRMTPGHSGPARVGPGDLLAALGALPPGRAAEVYATLGYRVG